jgi:ribosome biogenesis GTPase
LGIALRRLSGRVPEWLASTPHWRHSKAVETASDQTPISLAALGWSAHFADQFHQDETHLTPMRIATVHRARLGAESVNGPVKLVLSFRQTTNDFAVGDWVLVDPSSRALIRRLERKTLLKRHTESARIPQLIAANVDSLLIVTSCNADFNPARLERYLALANEAGAEPVIVLTKADQTDDVIPFHTQAAALQRALSVVSVNATDPGAAKVLAPWCGVGRTLALVGSSGVGKSTLLNTLADKPVDQAQPTGDIRHDDAKGRHTTTSRSLHRIAGGGWVIDTPGMRTLHLGDLTVGLETLFAEITDLAPTCRFRDCTHHHEPGCAVQAAVASGKLDQARLDRWRKLSQENRDNTPVQTGPRGNKKTQARQPRR